MKVTDEQLERYSRQMLLPGFGEENQGKLLNSSVLIVGAGGLGSSSALYLAGAGIGKIGIVDSDKVEIHNLHRQILHSTQKIGQNKTASAKQTLESLNPDIKVTPYNLRLSQDNAEDIFKQHDFIIDACDNFETKYLINDTCVKLKKPFSHAGVFQYKGQTMTVLPQKTACYRCVFPEPPEPGIVPTGNQAGIYAPVPGIIGIIQANEAIKYFTRLGTLLTNKLLIFNALESSFREVKVLRDKACKICLNRTQY